MIKYEYEYTFKPFCKMSMLKWDYFSFCVVDLMWYSTVRTEVKITIHGIL